MVYEITKRSDFARAVNNKPVVVVDFFATWCAPCKKIARVVEDWEVGMAHNSEDWLVDFVKVDVDALPKLARDYDISAMPTFIIFVNGERTATVQGAERHALRRAVEAAMQQAVDQRQRAGARR